MKTLLMISAALLLFGCNVYPQAEGEMEITVDIGETKTVGETAVSLKFVEVLEDSRCPEGADCFWAGNARIKIEVSHDEGTGVFYEVETNGPTKFIDFEGFRISLKSVNPYPKVNETIENSDYNATFAVDEAEPQSPDNPEGKG